MSVKQLPQTDVAKGELVSPTPSKIDLRNAHAIRRELASVYRDMRSGNIEVADGTKLAYVLDMLRKSYETAVLEDRLNDIEHTLKTPRQIMRANRIEKLYDKMPVNDRAGLVFEALCTGDHSTANKITNSVPRYAYTMIDTDFHSRLNNCFNVAYIWAAEYWKSYCKYISANGLQISAVLSRKDKGVTLPIRQFEKLDDLSHHWEQRLIALGLILKALEKSHGIKPNVVLHFADAHKAYGREHSVDDLEGDALKYYEMYLALFVSLLDGLQLDPQADDYFSPRTLD